MKDETKCYCEHTTYCDCGAETLEEANWKVLGTKTNTFFDGAKWQQERSYSEEDMEIAFGTMSTNWISFEEFIEQFKKK